MKLEDLTGKKFGQLFVVRPSEDKRNRIFWICRCDCGKYKDVAAKHLKSGAIKTCGSTIHRKHKASSSWKGFEELPGKYITQVKRGALARNLNFDISAKDMWQQALRQNGLCALTDIKLNFDTNNNGNASLDRINSDSGYTKDNIQWVDKRINLMKMHIPQKEFIELCKLVANKN